MLPNNESRSNMNDPTNNKEIKNGPMSEICRQYIDGTKAIMNTYIPKTVAQESDEDYKKDLVKMFYSDIIMSKLILTSPDKRDSYISQPDGPIEILKELVASTNFDETTKEMLGKHIALVTAEDVRDMIPFYNKFNLTFSNGPGRTIMKANEELYKKDDEAMKASAYIMLTGL